MPEAIVEQALSQMLTSGSVLLGEIDGEPLIFLRHLKKAEEGIAARIKALAGMPTLYPPIDFDKAVAWCERQTWKTLAPSQREALKIVLANRVVVITGGPGVGKTTLVNSILMIPDRFRLDPIRDVQVLCPMNRGSLGVREMNAALQKALNPARPGQHGVERFGWRFQIGDKVIQTENDYDKDVFNGDVGIVERVDTVEQQIAVRFDERLVKYDFGELDEISLAYAITIHKSQGSEFPAVVIPVATQHYRLLQRNLIYTGITRGKRLLVLIGQKKALGIAVRNDRPQRRYSGLLASLKGERQAAVAS